MSDLELPEHTGKTAFAELAEVVRHVSEQLAGYRRRALSAEAQVRELEPAVEREREAVASLKDVAGRMAVLEESLRAARAGVAAPRGDSAVDRAGLESQNAALRERLDEVNVRTGQIVERVRFLRQQLNAGGRG